MSPMKKLPRRRFDEDRDYDDPKYISWRNSVYRRDGFRCQMPGCNPKGRKVLHAHHIRKWADNTPLRFLVSNGITLCKVCHKKVTGNEESYQPLLTGIVLRNAGSTVGEDAMDLRLRMMLNRHAKRSEKET